MSKSDDRIDDIDDIIKDDELDLDDEITDYDEDLADDESGFEMDELLEKDFDIEEELDFDIDEIRKEKGEASDNFESLQNDSEGYIDEEAENSLRESIESGEFEEKDSEPMEEETVKKKHGKKVLKVFLTILGILIVLGIVFFGTSWGRKKIYAFAAKYFHGKVDYVEGKKDDISAFYVKIPTATPTPLPDDIGNDEAVVTPVVDEPVEEEIYARNYLLFGIEQLNGGMNTDTILILTINTKDKTLKFTSILRDTYVEIPGTNPNKINAAYAFGMKQGEDIQQKKYYGGMKLIEAIEKQFEIPIEGFACVSFDAFENIVNRLGGVDIELGSTEASYLRSTNYISNPAYRTVQAGWNHLNGNQALGYCRVRKVVTLGGANNDYGRTVRQRRVIKALVEAYKNKGITELLPILNDCLSYVTTNMTAEQITEIFTDVVENRITNFEEYRIPFDGMFRDSSKKGIFNGSYNVTYALVVDDYRDEVNQKIHDILYNDPTAVTDAPENAEAEVTGVLPKVQPAN